MQDKKEDCNGYAHDDYSVPGILNPSGRVVFVLEQHTRLPLQLENHKPIQNCHNEQRNGIEDAKQNGDVCFMPGILHVLTAHLDGGTVQIARVAVHGDVDERETADEGHEPDDGDGRPFDGH